MDEQTAGTLGRRDTHRVVLEPKYTIHFRIKDRSFELVPLANLSPGGCFATVSQRDGANIEKDDFLEQILFDNPELPQVPLQGRVAFALRSEDPDGQFEYTGIGVAFVNLPREATQSLEHFVNKRLELD